MARRKLAYPSAIKQHRRTRSTTLAKKIVNYLEKATLPAPEKYGKIIVDTNDSSNQATQVIWQEPNNVFTVTHQDALAALEMAAFKWDQMPIYDLGHDESKKKVVFP